MSKLILRAFAVAFFIIAVIATWGAAFMGAPHHFVTAFICVVLGVILSATKD